LPPRQCADEVVRRTEVRVFDARDLPAEAAQFALGAFELIRNFLVFAVANGQRHAGRHHTNQDNDDGQNGVSGKSVLFRRFSHLPFRAVESRERKHYSLCLALRKVNCANAYFGVHATGSRSAMHRFVALKFLPDDVAKDRRFTIPTGRLGTYPALEALVCIDVKKTTTERSSRSDS